ncbi:MAG: IPT/TIG domain-containing protein [Bacteroidota bacterium]|nr:IPT/TIG domain-containing protein [Bacteroidota bacterium]
MHQYFLFLVGIIILLTSGQGAQAQSLTLEAVKKPLVGRVFLTPLQQYEFKPTGTDGKTAIPIGTRLVHLPVASQTFDQQHFDASALADKALLDLRTSAQRLPSADPGGGASDDDKNKYADRQAIENDAQWKDILLASIPNANTTDFKDRMVGSLQEKWASLNGITVTGINPPSGPAGSRITITGSNLQRIVQVAFTGKSTDETTVAASNFQSLPTPTTLEFAVPNDAVTGPIMLTDASTAFVTTPSFQVSTAPPTITSLPITSGAPGTTIILKGTGLAGTSAVKFPGATVPVTFTSGDINSLTVIVPPLPAAGPMSDYITLDKTNGRAISAQSFTYSSLEPNYAPANSPGVGVTLRIHGTDFTANTRVTFDGTPLDNPEAITPTLNVIVPAALLTTVGPHKVKITGGGTVGPDETMKFQVTQPIPFITDFNPDNASAGTKISLRGSNLANLRTVTFNGATAPITAPVENGSSSPTSAVVTVPVGAITGDVVPAGGSASAKAFTVTTTVAEEQMKAAVKEQTDAINQKQDRIQETLDELTKQVKDNDSKELAGKFEVLKVSSITVYKTGNDKKAPHAIAYTVNVDKIKMDCQDGLVFNIQVLTTDESGTTKRLFTNARTTIPISDFNRRNDFLHFGRELEYIKSGDILRWVAETSAQPDDANFTLTKQGEEQELTRDGGINQVINLRLYTDLLGVFGEKPNGLAQTEASFRSVINEKNLRDNPFYLLRDFKIDLMFARLDEKRQNTYYRPADISTLSRTSLYQRAFLNTEVHLNLFNGRLAGAKRSFYLDLPIAAGVSVTNLAAITSNATTSKNDTISRAINLPYIAPSIQIGGRLGSNAGYRFVTKLLFQYGRDLTDIYGPRSTNREFLIFEPEIYWNPLGAPASRFFVRARYNELFRGNESFYQVQLGYTLSISQALKNRSAGKEQRSDNKRLPE